MKNFTEMISEGVDLDPSRLDEAVEPAVKTYMDLWAKRTGLTMKVDEMRKGRGGMGDEKWDWKDYKIGAYTKTGIFLGQTAISFQEHEDTGVLKMRSVHASSSGMFMEAGWDEKNIARAKKDIEKTMKSMYPDPRTGGSKAQGKKLARQIGQARKGKMPTGL